MTDTDTLTAPPQTKLDDGDHDRFSHWVKGGNAAILKAMIDGSPCEALCGKWWVPSRDPEKFPVCPECDKLKKELYG